MKKPDSTDQMRRCVRFARQAAGLKQSELGARAGISQAKLSLYELGQTELTSEELRRVNRVLDKSGGAIVPLSEILRPSLLRTLLDETKAGSSEEIAQRKLQRQAIGLSQSALAKRMGIRRARLSGSKSARLGSVSGYRLEWRKRWHQR